VRRALVVGIDDYPFGPLGGCVADAEAVADLLVRHDDGTKNFDVRRLTGPPDTITRGVLREAITELFGKPAEVALFYFSGHGSENDLGGYLVTPDAQAYDEGVAMSEVINRANKSVVSESIIIVDCCHSGHLANDPVGPRDANVRAEMAEGVSILTASRSTELSIESGGRGVFTTLLCSALDGGAADVLGDTKIAAIYSYIDESLGSWQQRPLFKTHVSSLLSLRTCHPSISLDKLRRIVDYFPEQHSQLTLDPSFERTHESADPANVEVFDHIAAYRNARLVEVVTHDHLYFAAIHSGTVRLTPLGRHYRRLIRENRL
jgi:Caspase domain